MLCVNVTMLYGQRYPLFLPMEVCLLWKIYKAVGVVRVGICKGKHTRANCSGERMKNITESRTRGRKAGSVSWTRVKKNTNGNCSLGGLKSFTTAELDFDVFCEYLNLTITRNRVLWSRGIDTRVAICIFDGKLAIYWSTRIQINQGFGDQLQTWTVAISCSFEGVQVQL